MLAFSNRSAAYAITLFDRLLLSFWAKLGDYRAKQWILDWPVQISALEEEGPAGLIFELPQMRRYWRSNNNLQKGLVATNLLLSMQCLASAAHIQAYGFEWFGRWCGLPRFVECWPAIFIFWPEPIQNPLEVTCVSALLSAAIDTN